MPPTSRWKTFYLTHLAKPAADRLVYRAILHEKIGRIVELGIGDGSRALRMIDAAARHNDHHNIHYIGIDSFEDREPADGPGLTLIEAHRLLKPSAAKIKLIPGDPCEALVRSANLLTNIDLLLLGATAGLSSSARNTDGQAIRGTRHLSSVGALDAERLERIWFFVPRMLHERSLVLLETADTKGEKTFRRIERIEINRLANNAQRRKAA